MRRSLFGRSLSNGICEEDKSRVDSLRICRRSINWQREEPRLDYVREAVRVIMLWSSQQVLDLRKILSSEEIDRLVSDCVNHPIYNNCYSNFDVGAFFIDYLAKSGDRAYLSPRIDPQGRPVLLCSTPVHRAAKTDRWQLVGPLLDLFDSYDMNDIDPESHYHIACMAGLASVERFIEHGQDPNGLVLTGTNDSPLHLALDYVYYNQAAEILLSRKANPNSVNAKGETPLHVICKCRDDVKTLEKMFKIAGDYLNQQLQVNARDNMGNAPLHLALTNRRYESAELLLRRGADPTLANEKGETPLHIICNGDQDDDSIELFFKICDEKQLQVQVDARDKLGNTPLHLALTNRRIKSAEPLLKRGADPTLANEKGETPLHIICKGDQDHDSIELFFKICDEKQLQVQVDARDKLGNTPLHLALTNRRIKSAEPLLKRGADPTLANEKGETPLHIICKGDQDHDSIELFFKICDEKQLQVQVDARDKLGNTPLHLALTNRRIKSAEPLLKRGADPTLANEKGETPLHIICNGDQDHDSIELFFKICDEKNLKVDVNAKDSTDRTPLQWAVATLKLHAVQYLWEREGIDTSSLTFPTERDLDELVASHARDSVASKLKLIPDVVGFVDFPEDAQDYNLVVSDVLKIMKFFIKLGVYMLSVELREKLKNDERVMENFRRELSVKKYRENKSFYDLIQSGVHAASQIFTYSEFKTTCKLFRSNHLYHKYVKLKICEIMLRKFFLGYAMNYFEEMTGYRLPRECNDMIIDEDFTNNDLYKLCLAAANESDRQNGEIDAMTDAINFYCIGFSSHD